MPDDAITVRRATGDDMSEIIDVCAKALAWSDGPTDEAFFRWKHLENPFGASPIWVAEDRTTEHRSSHVSDRTAIVGVRAMMRWSLADRSGREIKTVRAVDTATLPEYQGRGIFSRLTMAAVETLTDDGVAAVFNTPNDKSRPGYLKMGWREIGRLPVFAQPRSVASAMVMVRSKVPADKWGIETAVGLDPADALADPGPVEAAIAANSVPAGMTTPLGVEYLRWRTGFGPLRARIAPLHTSMADGFIVFRLRRRGELRQLSVLHVVGPSNGAGIGRAIRRLLTTTEADVVLAAGTALGPRQGLFPLPGAGPKLTWRALADPAIPQRTGLSLELGAIELF